MPTTGANSTPQTFRYQADLLRSQSHLTRAKFALQAQSLTQQLRNSFDSELWDDLANVVYYKSYGDHPGVTAGTTLTFGTLTIPCPVACRAELSLRATMISAANGDGKLHILVDGVEVLPFGELSSVSAWTGTCTSTVITDLAAGIHTVTFTGQATTMGVDFYGVTGWARRGRMPTP